MFAIDLPFPIKEMLSSARSLCGGFSLYFSFVAAAALVDEIDIGAAAAEDLDCYATV